MSIHHSIDMGTGDQKVEVSIASGEGWDHVNFDLTKRGRDSVVLCQNATRQQVLDLVAALTEAVEFLPKPEPEPEPEPEPAPDIEGFDVYSAEPTMLTATVDGQDFVIGNWFNFEGWEVRNRPTSSSGGRCYGFLRNVGVAGAPCTAKNRWLQERQFARRDDAVRWLVSTF